MKSILLTGSTGFIGSRLLIALSRQDYSINLLSRLNSNVFPTAVCDFLKDDIPENSLNSIDTIFHLAGYSHDFNADSKTKYLHQTINVDATIKLAELAVKNNVRHFIFISSVKAAGVSKDGSCLSEDFEGMPEGSYAESKKNAENKLLDISRNSNMRVSIIRPALVYGPKPKGNLELLYNSIKRDRFLPIPKINNRRSMIHIDDLVRAIVFISQNKEINSEIFHVTDGLFYSTRRIYETMCLLQGKSPSKWFAPVLFLKLLAFIHPKIKLKVNKIIQNECYCAKKISNLGFKTNKTLREMNETNF